MKLFKKIFIFITSPIWGVFYVVILIVTEMWEDISEWVDKAER